MSISNDIKKIIDGVAVLKNQCSSNASKHGYTDEDMSEVNFSDKNKLEAVIAQVPFRDEFKTLLLTIPQDSLLKIQALMYSGRDENPYAISYTQCQNLHQSHERIVGKLAEKSSCLKLYIENGTSRLREDNIDLDTI